MVRFVREQLGRLAPCFVASALIALASCSSNSTPTGQPASSVSRALPAAGSELIFPPFAGFSGNLIVPTNDAAASTNVKLASYNLQPSRHLSHRVPRERSAPSFIEPQRRPAEAR